MNQIIIYSTFPSFEDAQKIAQILVERRLAACANIFAPHFSVYRWQGKVERGEEVAMILKTTNEKFKAVEQAIKELHSYDTPCIVAWPIEKGHAPFLKWINEETS